MTTCFFWIKISDDAPPDIKKELEALGSISPVFGIQFMLHKGLRYIPTIIAWAHEFGGSYGDMGVKVRKKHRDLMLNVYQELEGKVNVKMDRYPSGAIQAVIWPCEILDLKEVQEEAKLLATSDEILFSTKKVGDYWLVRKDFVDELELHRKMPRKECMERGVRIVNEKLREWGNYFLKALEVHRKYPNIRFWFLVTGG
ncbi:MAG: hypothetical protein QXZ66_09335 [Thermoproteota archaeon]|nr:hypothetical protein [Candidatus Brockarchaeota archaeon]